MKKIACIISFLLIFTVSLAFAANPGNAPLILPQPQGQISGVTTAIRQSKEHPGLPDAPKDLHATIRSATRIDLYWRYYDVSTEDGFVIERRTNVNGEYEVIYVNDRTNLLYEDHRVAPNTTYFYRVRAFNRDGYTEPCTEVQATTPSGGPD